MSLSKESLSRGVSVWERGLSGGGVSVQGVYAWRRGSLPKGGGSLPGGEGSLLGSLCLGRSPVQ